MLKKMKIIQSLRIPYQKDPDLVALAAEHLGIEMREIASVRATKKSLDARGKQKYLVYSLEVFLQGESTEEAFAPFKQINWHGPPPLIIGAGPAGLFAAWTFLQHGIKPILLEQGERTHTRMQKISRFWRQGILDTRTNVCHGEGGAGTFSDGKLITRIKSPLIARVMRAFVDYGAPEEITYVYNPHVGSNLIRNVIKRMSDDLIARGASLRFSTKMDFLDIQNKKVEGIILENGEKISGTGVILACGHSAGTLFTNLQEQGVLIEPKSFAIGLRIEHPQEYINKLQYGKNCDLELETAQYKFAHHWEQENIGTYTFCMCPGGYVISSGTDSDGTVVNGMSNYHRNSPWANAAVVCTVDKDKIDGTSPFKMLAFQREIEQKTFLEAQKAGSAHRIPAQRLEDFLNNRMGSKPLVKSSCPSGVVSADVSSLIPKWMHQYLSEGILQFDKKRKGFAHPEALLHAVESRTSSPIRITRNPDTMESISTLGLYPVGEGPGYAGGITSAAVDGMKAALAWIEKFTM